MWIIVCFDEENAVEAVPTHWYKNGQCAWPKKNIKKLIEHRNLANKFDFNYYPSRILKKGIATLHEARERVKVAEKTSDLSSFESRTRKETSAKDFVEPPQFIIGPSNTNEKIDPLCTNSQMINLSTTDYINTVPAFSPVIERSEKRQLFFGQDKLKNKKKPKKVELSLKKKNLNNIDYSPEKDNTGLQIDTTPVNRNLFDNIMGHSSEEDNLGLTVINTSASPFKVTCSNYIPENSKITKEAPPQNKLLNTPKSIPSFDKHSDVLKRILNVVLKIRYDVQSVQQKQIEMEQVMNDKIYDAVNANRNSSYKDTSKEAEDFYLMIPIMNEDQLYVFEEKLLEKSYRSSVVNELKRLQKNELNSTVRGILKTLFDDNVLKEYSYVGQKKKKIFSSLRSCALVFDTIRKMHIFQSATNKAIENPIKTYIAGAGFRKHKNKN